MFGTKLQQQDLKYNWHPCSQMKDYEQFKPLEIERAYGSYLQLADGKKLIDGIASWWCKSLGHNHPKLKEALLLQIERFEHVIFANTTHDNIVNLSKKLTNLMPNIDKVFYAGDGSCAVEIAMKMSLHYRKLTGKSKKVKFIALKNGYHGETSGSLSVSDLGLYREPYRAMLFDPILIEPLYVNSVEEVSWLDAQEHWQRMEKQLVSFCDEVTAIIVEPIIQGAGGMRLYSQNFLNRLYHFAKAHDIHLIADEIMTGMGRTGKMLACEHAEVQPDFICLSKGLTSGWLPFSAVLTTNNIYQAFYDDYESGKAFLHSHTYSGHALGVSLALTVLQLFESEDILEKANTLQILMRQQFIDIASKTGFIGNIRGIGGVIAADLIEDNRPHRAGYYFYQEAIARGALIRPLGHTIYWFPPLNIHTDLISKLGDITLKALKQTYKI